MGYLFLRTFKFFSTAPSFKFNFHFLSVLILLSLSNPLFSMEEELSIIQKTEQNFELRLYARNFAQGEIIQIRIKPLKEGIFSEKFKLVADGKIVSLSPWKGEMIGFIPIHPERKPGSMIIELHSRKLYVNRKMKKYEIDIGATDFLVIKKQSIKLDKKFTQKKYDSKTLKFIEDCTKAKTIAFASSTPLQIKSGFQYPVSVVSFSSPFYVRRDYNEKKGRPHGGVDFRGKAGTPIFAVNDGKVVLAREMYFEGNFTIIDHGNKIFSFYMHQSKLLVKPGQKVKKGQKIGLIGSTGMSTGPHLHLGVKVADTLVHPLALLAFKDI
ncbi:MAG: M23 family metallopeptidase [Leptospira sp.]|nr:M23 family metallopeptidase [Leptospira sp.]